MVNQELVKYIKIQLESEADEESIKSILISHGWNIRDVDVAFNFIKHDSEKNNEAEKIVEVSSNLVSSSASKSESVFVDGNSNYYQESNVNENKIGSSDDIAKNNETQKNEESKDISRNESSDDAADDFSKTEPGKTRKQKPLLKIFLLIVLVLALLVGIGFGYYYFFTPKGVTSRAISSFAKVKTFEISGLVTISSLDGFFSTYKSISTSGSSDDSSLKLNLNGVYDSSNLEDIKSSTIFTTNVNSGADQVFDLGLESRFVNSTSYFKIISKSSTGIIDLSKLSDKWIRYSVEEIKSKMSPAELENYNENQKNTENTLNNEKVNKIVNIIKKSKVLGYGKMSSENVNGISTNKIQFNIDKMEIKNLYIEIAQASSDKTFTDQEISNMMDNLDKIIFSNGTIWVGKKDSLPYKFSLDIDYLDRSETNISIDVNFAKYNETVNIAAPTSSISLDEFIKNLLTESNLFNNQTESSL
jgi:hypothetical protein